jgi:hypothetical protein
VKNLGTFCQLIVDSFSRESSELPSLWTPEVASTGQCHVASALVWLTYGGRVLRGTARGVGAPQSLHYWNVLPNGITLDLTRSQYPVNVDFTDIQDATHEQLNIGTMGCMLALIHTIQQEKK